MVSKKTNLYLACFNIALMLVVVSHAATTAYASWVNDCYMQAVLKRDAKLANKCEERYQFGKKYTLMRFYLDDESS